METLTDVVFKPLTGLGRGLSGFYNEVLSETPLLWTPVILIFTTLVLILTIFVLSGYRFKSLLFSIEPSKSNPVTHAIRNHHHQTLLSESKEPATNEIVSKKDE